MKSFSFKALALAFIVVAGSANAGITETVRGYASSAKNGVVNAVNAADVKLFGEWTTVKNVWPFENTHKYVFTPGLPVLSSHLRFENGYARAAVVTVAGAAIVAAIVKTYKHFTKPAADATVEGENVEANETTVEVA